jgi:hypothetical protein
MGFLSLAERDSRGSRSVYRGECASARMAGQGRSRNQNCHRPVGRTRNRLTGGSCCSLFYGASSQLSNLIVASEEFGS